MINRRFWPTVVVSSAAIACLTGSAVHSLTLSQLKQKVANVSVRIEGQNPGTGVIINKKYAHSVSTYFILTAAHVVETEDEYWVVMPDGRDYQLDYQRVRKIPGFDAALIEIDSRQDYEIATYESKIAPEIGEDIFVSGYPAPTAAINQRVFNLSSGKLINLNSASLADGYGLIYDNATVTGMSGGGVFSAHGHLIGVHGRADARSETRLTETVYVKSGINLGIALQDLLKVPQALVPPSPSLSERQRVASELLEQAKVARAQNNSEGAIALLIKSLSIQPNPKEAAIAFEQLGTLYRQNKNFSQAINAYSEAIDADASLDIAYVGRYLSFEAVGAMESAAEDFNQAIRLNSRHQKSLVSLKAQHRIAVASAGGEVAYYQQLIRDNPDDPYALVKLAIALLNANDTQRGARSLLQAWKHFIASDDYRMVTWIEKLKDRYEVKF